MRKLITFVLILGVVTFAALAVNDMLNQYLVLSSSAAPTHKTHRLFLAHPENEIPILGSSRAQAHYVPSLLAPNAFNYGIDGSGMYETLFQLKQAIRNQAEGPIIINLDPWGFRGEYTQRLLADYTLVVKNEAVREELFGNRVLPADYWPGLRFYGTLRKNLATWMNGRKAMTKRVDNGAVLLLTSRNATEWEYINSNVPTETFHFDASWEVPLEEICTQTKRPLIWVIGPTSPQWRKQFTGITQLHTFIERLNAYPNNYVIDLYTTTTDYTEADFADTTHLNESGAIRFTMQLKGYLSQMYSVVFRN
jgi:hypothetical protein